MAHPASSLMTAPVAPLLDRLFIEVEASSPVSAVADLPETVDLLLLDGAKALDPEILDRIEPRLRPGALVIADDAEDSPDYLARVRDPACGYLSVPFGEDVELSVRLG